MDYKRAYSLPFKPADWAKNLLLLAVCVLIPIVGVMIILGYRSETLDRWLDDRSDEGHGPFDFNRFSEQLQRGIWPFLYQMIIGLVFGFLVAAMYVALVAIVIASQEPTLFFIGLAFFYLCLLVIQVFVKAIVWPFTLRGQISGKFDFGAAWRFAKEFYSRIGFVNLVGIALCCMLIDMVVMIVGMMLFCVGMYPAIVVIMLAENHILWQLYRRHLEAGGSSIPRIDQPERTVPRGDAPAEGV